MGHREMGLETLKENQGSECDGAVQLHSIEGIGNEVGEFCC